jgi:cytochrome c-type biogenesis protein CcmH/NrfG
MGHNLDVEGADDKAEQQLREAIRLEPNRAEARGILGIQYAGSGRAADGERELRAALQFATADVLPPIQIALAFSCYQQGKFADSAHFAGEVLKTHPDHSMAKGIYERSQSVLAGGAPPKTIQMNGSAPAPPAPTPRPR